MAESISKWCDWQGITYQNIQIAHPAQPQQKTKNQTTQLKNRQITEIAISPNKTQMANNHIKRYSTSLIIRRNANQNYIRHCLTPARMAMIKVNNKCWRGCRAKGTFLRSWWECKLVQPLWRTVWRFHKRLKIELPYDPAIPVLGTYPDKTIAWNNTCTPKFTAALLTTAKTRRQTKCLWQMKG